MKQRNTVPKAAIVGLALTLASTTLYADVTVDSSLSVSNIIIVPGAGNVQLSNLSASAFVQVFDSLGGVAQDFQTAVGGDASATAATSLINSTASASAQALTLSGTGNINIPQGVAAVAGTNPGSAFSLLQGFFEITGVTGPVNVRFSATADGHQSLDTHSGGQFASSELSFILGLDGTPVLFFDNLLQIGPGSSASSSFTSVVSGSATIDGNTPYYFAAEGDYEPSGYTPEPSFYVLIALGLGGIVFAKSRWIGRCKNWLTAILVLPLLLPGSARAKYIPGDPASSGCPCNNPKQGTGNKAELSFTQGNLVEPLAVSATRSANGPTIELSFIYNSYDADDSQDVRDTVMGYGWTHSYNVFLFSQLGAMFRYDGNGNVTRYAIAPGGGFLAAPGYFETLVRNADGSFTLAEKDKTTYIFQSVPSTPFLVAGPVWRLTRIVDRNGNTTGLTYIGGNLTAITDTYGRTTALTYNGQNKLASISDAAGRVTALRYDATGHLLIGVTDPNGKSIQYAYNGLFQLTRRTDKDGRVSSYLYANGKPVTAKDSAGAVLFTLSNPNNWATDPNQLALYQLRVYLPSTTSHTDGRGNLWKNQYDSNGHITKTVAPDGATTSYAYDPSTLQVTSLTDPNGRTSTYQYDSMGNRIRATDALGNNTTYSYEPVFNMITSMTDPRGRVTTYTYDLRGNRLQENDPLGQTRNWTYDSNGNVLTSTDQNGHTTSYRYDAFGNRIKITDPLGYVTTVTYDAVGNIITRTDANLHTTSYQYDGMNRLTKETDALMHTTQTSYDGEGDRIQVIDRNGHSTAYQYDLRQRLTKTTDAMGNLETYSYDGNDNRVSVTDRNGHTMMYGYDLQNRRNRIEDALGDVMTTMYDGVGNVISQTDANLHTTVFSYDAVNRRVMMTDPANEQTRYKYDTGTFTGPVTLGGITLNCAQCGATPGSSLVTEQVDPDGTAGIHAGVIFYKYDALNRLVIRERKTGCIGGPAGSGCPDTITSNDALTLYTYDPFGNRLTLTEPNANTTTSKYDADNRRTQEINAAGDTTEWTYDPAGNVSTVTTPNLNATTSQYDPVDRLVQVTDSIGLYYKYTYDSAGNRLSQSDGNSNRDAYGYDPLNRLITWVDALGTATSYQFDAVGDLVKTIDRNGNTDSYIYDAINRRISATDPLFHTTQYQYDPVGNLTALTDANSHSTQYSYDNVDRPVRETYTDATVRTFTYDEVGNLATRTDEIGQITTYTYSDLYFLLSRIYPSAVNDTFSYDLSGRRLTAQRGGWALSFFYDGANRLIRTLQNGRSTAYNYNIPARTRTVTYPGGRTITEHTDARTRLAEIDDASSAPIVQYAYDLANRVLNRTYRNGTSAAYTYNADNWITNLRHSSDLTPIATFTYAFDNEGNKQFEDKLQDPAHSEAYQYDSTYRLINYRVGSLVGPTVPVPITQTSYALDPVGNWNTKTTDAVTQTRQHNSVNELVKLGATGLTYSGNGNLLNDTTFSYVYDEENRLTRVTRVSDSSVVGQYQYDALGRRVQKIADPAGSPVTVLYFYDGPRIIEEQDSTGGTQATYVYGNYVDEVLTMDRAGQTYYYHQNALWSVEAISDSAANPVERYTYDAYGAPTISNGAGAPLPLDAWGTPISAVGSPWMFTGRQLDQETGIYFYRARYYSASLGRFITRDPLGTTAGTNLYEYVSSSPTYWIDPLGLKEICCFYGGPGQGPTVFYKTTASGCFTDADSGQTALSCCDPAQSANKRSGSDKKTPGGQDPQNPPQGLDKKKGPPPPPPPPPPPHPRYKLSYGLFYCHQEQISEQEYQKGQDATRMFGSTGPQGASSDDLRAAARYIAARGQWGEQAFGLSVVTGVGIGAASCAPELLSSVEDLFAQGKVVGGPQNVAIDPAGVGSGLPAEVPPGGKPDFIIDSILDWINHEGPMVFPKPDIPLPPYLLNLSFQY